MRFDDSGSHAGAHIDPTGRAGKPIETISIDDLVGDESAPIIVKLDVEGAEIAAFAGASETMKRPALFIYEDHAIDPSSRVTDWLLKNTDLTIWYIADDGQTHRIGSAEQAIGVTAFAEISATLWYVRIPARPLGFDCATATTVAAILRKIRLLAL